MGFEPTVGFPTLDFESSALNRTQPPFRDEKKNVEPAYAKSSGVASAERLTSNVQRNYHTDILSARRPCLLAATSMAGPRVASSLTSRVGLGKQDSSPHEVEKCYNFMLAMPAELTASCISTRTATLLLVVDRYSQVLGAAVHQYCQLIRKPQPLPYRHDSTQTRNSARVTK